MCRIRSDGLPELSMKLFDLMWMLCRYGCMRAFAVDVSVCYGTYRADAITISLEVYYRKELTVYILQYAVVYIDLVVLGMFE